MSNAAVQTSKRNQQQEEKGEVNPQPLHDKISIIFVKNKKCDKNPLLLCSQIHNKNNTLLKHDINMY